MIVLAPINILLQLFLLVVAPGPPICLVLLVCLSISGFIVSFVAEVRRNAKISRGAPYLER